VLGVFGFGLGFHGTGIYLRTIVDTKGWSVSLVSAAVTIHFLAAAAVMPALAFLYRRFGVAQITKLGALTLALGVLGWATVDAPWGLFVASLVSGAGWAATCGVALNAIVTPWFDRQRPAALSLAYNGGSIGGLIFPTIWAVAIGFIGFPWAALIVCAVMTITIWMLAGRFFVQSPASMGLTPDGGASTATTGPFVASAAMPLPGSLLWRNRRFITLAAGMALGFFAQFGMIAHLFSLLVPALGTQAAGVALGAIGLAAILGRQVFAKLLVPGRDRRVAAAFNLGVQILGSIVFFAASGDSVFLLLTGVVLFGLGLGNGASLPPLIAQVEFTKDDVSRAVPAIIGIAQATSAFGPMVFGLIRDLMVGCATSVCVNTPLVFATAATIQFLACACFLIGRR
jgi:MFS family permease